jgi:asparagine synthase (glutamine-hydrolysing)
MCGIFGMVTQQAPERLFRVDLESLKNRGPDNIGQYIDRNVGLFHTRLAVIDRHEASNQPILSSCKNYAVVCNGEIYNYKPLKKNYSYLYQTTSDCELILAVYAEKGIDGFSSLKGMFSFGLYDKKSHKLIVYRDAVGKKPLFFYRDNSCFVFSSSVQSIKDNLKRSLTLDREAIGSYLKNGFVRPDRTIYQEIQPLLPGHLITVDTRTQQQSIQYLIPQSSSYQTFDYCHENIVAETERLLNQSISRRINRIEQPVLLFSGGIDSTVLAKKLIELSSSKLTCISLKPLIPGTYDVPYANYAAKKLGITHLQVGFKVWQLKDEIEQAILRLDQPLSIYSYFFLSILTRKAKEFGNVVFTGDGGDEVFYGYSSIDSWFSSSSQAFQSNNIFEYTVGPQLRAELTPWARQQSLFDLLGHGFVKVDKATAEQQMEARCPFLDWDLMHFVRTVPPSYFLNTGRTKPLLKSSLPSFPKWFLERPKIGFSFNFRYLMIPLYANISSWINPPLIKDLGLPSPDLSLPKVFKNFDYIWKLSVLSKLFCNYS